MSREQITIEGMGCAHCVQAVRSALEKTGATVHEVEIGKADVSFGPEVDRAAVDAAIEEAGYRAVEHQTVA